MLYKFLDHDDEEMTLKLRRKKSKKFKAQR